MRIFGSVLVSFFLVSSAAGEEKLEAVLEELRGSFDKLEGYQATYEAKTETGKTATFTQGEDHASGWAFAKMELRNAEGKVIGEKESWSTGDDHYFVKNDDDFVKFEGLLPVINRFKKLGEDLFLEKGEILAKIHSTCNLTPTGVSMVVGLRSKSPYWLNDVEGLISLTDQEATLDWGELGTITVNRDNGLLTSQSIKVDGGVREMKLTRWRKNPGEKALAGLMKLDPADAVEGPETTQITLTPMLFQIYQALVEKIGDDPEFGDTLKETLPKTEDQLVSFLHQQPLSPIRKKRIVSMMSTVDKIGADLEKSAAKRGQDLNRKQILSNANLAKKIAKEIAHRSAKDSKESTRKECLETALGNSLKAKGAIEKKARLLIEDAILAAYFRTELEKAMLLYLRN